MIAVSIFLSGPKHIRKVLDLEMSFTDLKSIAVCAFHPKLQEKVFERLCSPLLSQAIAGRAYSIS